MTATREASVPHETQNADVAPEPDYAGILSLHKLAREQESISDLGFVLANQTHRLVPYYQGFVWELNRQGRVRIIAASGVSEFDRHAPVIRFLESFISRCLNAQTANRLTPLNIANFAADIRQKWNEWLPPVALWCPFIDQDQTVRRGMLVTAEEDFSPQQLANVSAVSGGYAHAWQALTNNRRNSPWLAVRRFCSSRWLWIALATLMACLFLPVRFSILASARVVPVNPVIVAAPINAVIERVVVKPNQTVNAGDLLFEFNDTQAQTDYELAQSEYRIAIADYEVSIQRSFSDSTSKAQSETLALLVDEKRLAVDYAKLRLDQTDVYAESDGIALFVDANNWRGRPVSTGERIMTLADARQVEIEIQLPPADGGAVAHKADVEFFLDTDPNNPLPATVRQIAFEAELSNSGELVYPVTAQLNQGAAVPRLGLKGTAKIYGDEVSIFYYLFRKPWSVVRQYLNL